jgi:hypothetical protein
MPWGAAIAAVGTIAASAISSSGSSAGGTYGGSANTYIPGNQPQVDSNLNGLETGLLNSPQVQGANALYGQYQGQVNDLLNNPYSAQAMQGAETAANYGTDVVAPGQASAAASLYNLGNQGVPYASQILQTGFDPQHALYNRTQQQLTDQVNAQNAMSGLSGSPYGAGVANQAASNFNIDWQNTQLQREQAAASGYGSLVNSTGQAYSGASTLGNGAQSTYATSAGLPYSTFEGQNANNISALNALTAAGTSTQTPTQNLINDYNSYLNLGQSATSQAITGQQNQFAQGQTVGSNIGQTLSNPALANSLSNLFNSSSPTYADTNTPTVANYTNPYGAANYPAYDYSAPPV